jgi:L-seryl-tRNA(Ser) seleniumtransferase
VPDDVFARYGIARVINAVGYATRVGGGFVHDTVAEAMAQAQQCPAQIDDIQAAASDCIARHTGAEAGIVTCGAGAALTLAAAACLAGNDPDRMDRLPDTTGFARRRIVFPRPAEYDYDHAIRASGAVLDLVPFDDPPTLDRIDAAIHADTAAIGYVWKRIGQQPSVAAVADLAHRRNLPLIVDGALSLPPVQNLRGFIQDGADLVAISGGKHLGGPQASGLLFGRRDLIRSAWVQMVDMDVRRETWTHRQWIVEGWIERPPRHGIGRSMKTSKEAIIGLMVALDRYPTRDHDRELATWKETIAYLQRRLSGESELEAQCHFPASNGQPYPMLHLRSSRMSDILRSLSARNPKVILAEDEKDPSVAFVFPMCLKRQDLPALAQALIDATHDSHR